jgi:hypothetical protein
MVKLMTDGRAARTRVLRGVKSGEPSPRPGIRLRGSLGCIGLVKDPRPRGRVEDLHTKGVHNKRNTFQQLIGALLVT